MKTRTSARSGMAARFEHSLDVGETPARVLAAFFDERALAAWWDVAAVVAAPRPLAPYALEWAPAAARDDVFGELGGIYHGTVVDFSAGRGFMVAEAYWLPPESDPVGPMALEVRCSPGERQNDSTPGTTLSVVQSGGDDTPRWLRYYEIIGSSWPLALGRLKHYLEHGRGAWDLRSY